jgi:two-component system response regulator
MARLLNFLVAEDNENDRFFLESAFVEAGVQAVLTFVCDGEDVIEYLGGGVRFSDRCQFPYPDLLLLDMRMRRCDGFDVLKWMRGRAATRWMPVIVLSSSSLEKDVKLALDLGANSYLQKPVSSAKLVEMARAIGAFWAGHNVFPGCAR